MTAKTTKTMKLPQKAKLPPKPTKGKQQGPVQRRDLLPEKAQGYITKGQRQVGSGGTDDDPQGEPA